MTTDHADPLDPPTAALAAAILEISRHVELDDAPTPRWFALARTAELLSSSPGMASLLGLDEAAAADDPLHVTAIELDEHTGAPDPVASDNSPLDPLAGLEQVAWPELAAGGVLVCDLAPQAWTVRDGVGEADLRTGSALRVLVGATNDGTTWSAARRPGGEGYVLGAALVPELAQALVQTLQSTPGAP